MYIKMTTVEKTWAEHGERVERRKVNRRGEERVGVGKEDWGRDEIRGWSVL